MNINELDQFKLAKAINFNNDLNPQLYVGEKMHPVVYNKLMSIAEDFREFLGVEELALTDITVSGSNAAYSYTPHSDIDLHLVVDFSELPNDEIYRELFNAKKYQYNDMHDIKIKGYDVELYVQDSAQPHSSLGEYSLLRNDWNRYPTKQRANLDDTATLLKYEKLKDLAIRALASDDEEYLNEVLRMIVRYRRAGLSEKGEFGPENLAFKMVRRDGLFQKLWDKKREIEDRKLSLEQQKEKIDTDLERELAAEFNEGKASRKKTESMLKKMAQARATLFDDFDYDYVYEAAGRLSTFTEASYEGNIGAMEVMKFYEKASKKYIDLLTRLIAADKTEEAWKLIQKVTGTKLKGKESSDEKLTEWGRIVKGVNTTKDVGTDEIKKQAKKLGFKVTKDGVPPLLRESRTLVSELNMSPGRVSKEISKLASKIEPVIGLEFEVCIEGAEGDANPDITSPDITSNTTFEDIVDFFELNDSDDFEKIRIQYEEWLFDKQAEWADEQAQMFINKNPTYDTGKMVETMEDYTLDGDEEELVRDFTNGKEDTITKEVARDILEEVTAYIEKHGPVNEWDLNEDDPDWSPAIALYEVMTEDTGFADEIQDYFNEEFWNMDPYRDEDYSFGRWCLEHSIKDMYDVFREWEDTLYWPSGPLGQWPSGDVFNQQFDYGFAEQVASDLSDQGYHAFVADESDALEAYDDWVIKPDPSIRPSEDTDGGLEIATAKMDYEEGIEAIEWFTDYLNSNGAYTNESTGLHINVSMRNLDHSQLDYVKLVLLSGDDKILKQFNREFNEYAVNSMKIISDAINKETGFDRDKPSKVKAHAAVMAKMKSNIRDAAEEIVNQLNHDKYNSVSLKDDRIEFRSVGGNYLRHLDEILGAINRYVYAYAIASDPNAYKKEYAKKLYKLASGVGKDSSDTSLKLFAAYNAGNISKEQLVAYLKKKREEQPEQVQMTDKNDAIFKIAQKHNLDEQEARMRWMEAVEQEYQETRNEKKAQELAFRKLMSNPLYYAEQ